MNVLQANRINFKRVDFKFWRQTFALALVCAATLTLAACGGSKSENANANKRGSGTAEAAEARPVEVSTAEAVARQVPVFLQATGSLLSDEESNIAPQTSGQIIATFADVGDFVRQGEVIARIDDRDARLRLQQAQAGVTQAQSAVRQAEARLGVTSGGGFNANSTPEVRAARAALESAEASARLAETNARRYANLVETGDVARSVYDQFRTQAENARAMANSARQQLEAAQNAARGNNVGIGTAQAAVKAARSQVALAQKTVADTQVRAPFAGFISLRPTARGEYVTPASNIATLVRTNPIKLVLQIPEAEARRASVGMSVSANVSAYPDRQFAGRVAAINPVIDPASRALSVEVQLDNPENLLKSGMFATARINQPSGVEAVFVPRSAVTTNPNTNSSSLYVIEAGGEGVGDVARLRVVQIGEQEGDEVQIISGLRPAENVITSNSAELYDGARVSRR